MKTPKGTRDLLPEDTHLFQLIEQRALTHFARYGFAEIRTPIFEETALFHRSIGGDTDIVTKEMYSFVDKGGRNLTLRPEATASVCRAVLQHNLVGPDDVVRLMYLGPMFRHENPQAGRYRQFFQLGVEVFGSLDPIIDVETIDALMRFLEPFHLPNLELVLNSVGDQTDRPAYLEYLRRELSKKADRFCRDCQRRIAHNVLRVLDCKEDACQAELEGLEPISNFWSPENRAHFEAVCEGLTRLNHPFSLNPRLVRGLDYYTRTTFELISGDLGAQSAVMGGGRYDRLTEHLGGKAIPAFGWALGIDRLVAILKEHTSVEPARPDVFFVFGQRAWLDELFPFLCALRDKGLSVAFDQRVGSFKSQMKRANRSGARWAVILGDDEMRDHSVTVKDMDQSQQETIPMERLWSKVTEKKGENHGR